jgi:cytoskeletal protein CcmA (bactofilin family)
VSFTAPMPRLEPLRRPARDLAVALTVVSVLLALVPLPAQALERRTIGDVKVGAGEEKDSAATVLGDVTVEGTVREDVHSGFGDIQIVRGSEVRGDVDAGVGNVLVEAPVRGDVKAGFSDVYINSWVGGDVDVGHGYVELGPDALVEGDVSCGSGRISKDPEARIEGAQVMARMGGMPDPDRDHESPGMTGWLLATLGFAACSVLAAILAPRQLAAAAGRAEGAPWTSLLLGVASIPAVVVLMVVLAISVVGIPALMLLAPAYIALVLFGALVAAYFVGSRLLLATGRYRGGDALAAVVGAVLVAATSLIPFVGGVVLYGLVLFGTGAALLALIPRRRPGRPEYSSYEDYLRERRNL